MTPGFWSGGNEEYAKAVRAEYDHSLSLLHARLRSVTDDNERHGIEAKIAENRAELRAKLKAADDALF